MSLGVQLGRLLIHEQVSEDEVKMRISICEGYDFFEEHLNPSIYDCLESKIEPCGIVSMWESCKTYMIGDYVLYNGLV